MKVCFYTIDTFEDQPKQFARNLTPESWDDICMFQLKKYAGIWGFDIQEINNSDPLCKFIDEQYNEYAVNHEKIKQITINPDRNITKGGWHRETLKKAVRWIRFMESDYDIGVFYDKDIMVIDPSRNFLDEINHNCLYLKNDHIWCDDDSIHEFNNKTFWVRHMLRNDINRSQKSQVLNPSTGFMIGNKNNVGQILKFIEDAGWEFWKESGFSNMRDYMFDIYDSQPLRTNIPNYYMSLPNDEHILLYILNKYTLDSNIVSSHPNLCCDYDVIIDRLQADLVDTAKAIGYIDFIRRTKPIFYHAISDRKKWIKQIYNHMRKEGFYINEP